MIETERLVGEIAFDPEYAGKYLGIREEESSDGRFLGVLLVCSGSDPEVVRKVIEAARRIHDGLYYFFEPFDGVGDRRGIILGGGE